MPLPCFPPSPWSNTVSNVSFGELRIQRIWNLPCLFGNNNCALAAMNFARCRFPTCPVCATVGVGKRSSTSLVDLALKRSTEVSKETLDDEKSRDRTSKKLLDVAQEASQTDEKQSGAQEGDQTDPCAGSQSALNAQNYPWMADSSKMQEYICRMGFCPARRFTSVGYGDVCGRCAYCGLGNFLPSIIASVDREFVGPVAVCYPTVCQEDESSDSDQDTDQDQDQDALSKTGKEGSDGGKSLDKGLTSAESEKGAGAKSAFGDKDEAQKEKDSKSKEAKDRNSKNDGSKGQKKSKKMESDEDDDDDDEDDGDGDGKKGKNKSGKKKKTDHGKDDGDDGKKGKKENKNKDLSKQKGRGDDKDKNKKKDLKGQLKRDGKGDADNLNRKLFKGLIKNYENNSLLTKSKKGKDKDKCKKKCIDKDEMTNQDQEAVFKSTQIGIGDGGEEAIDDCDFDSKKTSGMFGQVYDKDVHLPEYKPKKFKSRFIRGDNYDYVHVRKRKDAEISQLFLHFSKEELSDAIVAAKKDPARDQENSKFELDDKASFDRFFDNIKASSRLKEPGRESNVITGPCLPAIAPKWPGLWRQQNWNSIEQVAEERAWVERLERKPLFYVNECDKKIKRLDNKIISDELRSSILNSKEITNYSFI